MAPLPLLPVDEERAQQLVRMIANGASRRVCTMHAEDRWGVQGLAFETLMGRAREIAKADWIEQRAKIVEDLLATAEKHRRP